MPEYRFRVGEENLTSFVSGGLLKYPIFQELKKNHGASYLVHLSPEREVIVKTQKELDEDALKYLISIGLKPME